MYKYINMSNHITFEDWKEYLKSDKEMKSKWNSLTEIWTKTNNEISNALNDTPREWAKKRSRLLAQQTIFNLLNQTEEKLDFAWRRKLIFNEKDERYEYVIACKNAASDYIFSEIKKARWVVSMQGESINKYLQPVANKIWALRMVKNTDRPQIQPKNLSYEAMRTKVPVALSSEKPELVVGSDKSEKQPVSDKVQPKPEADWQLFFDFGDE